MGMLWNGMQWNYKIACGRLQWAQSLTSQLCNFGQKSFTLSDTLLLFPQADLEIKPKEG